MTNKINLIEISQPIGTFYVGKMKTRDLLDIYKVDRRESSDGIQRDLNKKRSTEIKQYCEDPDATFPTPIILSVKSSEFELSRINTDFYCVEYEPKEGLAEILDGQHRIEGIKLASDFQSDLMIVLMFNLTEEEKAYVFSTINSKQTKVSSSLIYDLFDLQEGRSPAKTCHEIARILNSDEKSPFYKRLKMLGKKIQETESLSQGTFVTELLKLITKKNQEDQIKLKNKQPLEEYDLPFRKSFIDQNDAVILKILMNYFGSISCVFNDEWKNTNEYILLKTTGYSALIKAFPTIYKDGLNGNDLSIDYFKNQFGKTKLYLENENIKLTSEEFTSNAQGQSRLSEYILDSMGLK